MTYRLDIEINQLPTNQLNSRKHWSARLKESQQWDKLIQIHTWHLKPPAPLKKAMLTLVRYSASKMDWDNLAATWKHPVDALVTCKIIADDSWEVIGMPVYEQKPAKRGQGKVRLIVEGIA